MVCCPGQTLVGETEQRARAVADGQHDVASKLTYVFGSACCAECDALFRVGHTIVARWSS